MERNDCLGTIIMSPVPLNKSTYNHNPKIQDATCTWKQLKLGLQLRNVSFHLPIANSPFKASTLDGAFTQWKNQGINTVGDLYVKGTFASFQELREKYILNS